MRIHLSNGQNSHRRYGALQSKEKGAEEERGLKMAIISVIGFMVVLSIITGVIEHFQRSEERRKDRAAVRMIRNRQYHAAG